MPGKAKLRLPPPPEVRTLKQGPPPKVRAGKQGSAVTPQPQLDRANRSRAGGSADRSPQSGWLRWYRDGIASGVIVLATSSFGALAAFTDLQAFTALAEPATYAWLALSVICWCGILFKNYTRARGSTPPWYYPWVLYCGVACAFMTVRIPVRVLQAQAHSETAPSLFHGAAPDLRRAFITDTDYSGKTLRRARLGYARLTHVDLSDADLQEADLRHVVLRDVNLAGANLCGADLRGADLRGARQLTSVRDWSYAFYDQTTKLPHDLDFIQFIGPIEDTGRGLLSMCTPNETRKLKSGT